MSDAELLALLQAQDEHGLEILSRQYGALLRYIIAPILPDPQEAEECFSDVLLRVWNKIALYDPRRGSWRGWLTAIARNTALNRVRRRADAEELPEGCPSPEKTPEEALLHKERIAALQNAVGKLSRADRELFYRKYYYLQPISQIAAETRQSERAVEGRLYRLRKTLRAKLGGEGLE